MSSVASQERLYSILRAPHMSEKAAMVGEQSQYVFKVAVDATKQEVKAAVELVCSVDVEKVRVVNVKGKVRRARTGVGRRNDWKKAYVSLAQGQEIDITDIKA